MGSPPPLDPSLSLSDDYIAFHYSHSLHHPNLEVSGWSADVRTRERVKMARDPVDGVSVHEGVVRWGEDQLESREDEDWRVGLGKGECKVGIFVPDGRCGEDGKLPIFIYIPGGGFVSPTPQTSSFLTRVALNVPCVLIVPRPRIAPEDRWPAGVEDNWHVVRWILDSRAQREWDMMGLGVNADKVDWTRVALGGASAGGNVAAIFAEKLARPLYAASTRLTQLLLFNPVLDNSASPANSTYPSWILNQSCPDLSAATMLFYRSLYLPLVDPPPLTHPLLSPALAPLSLLARLPRVWICEGSADLVRDEGLVFADRVREAKGLDGKDERVEVKVYEGATHGYTIQDGVLEVGRRFIDDVTAALQAGFSLSENDRLLPY